MYRIVYISALLALFAATPLRAQHNTPTFGTDTRVRITAPTLAEKPIVGAVFELRPNTLIIKPDLSHVWTIPLESVIAFEVSQGRKPLGKNILKSAAIGALALGWFIAESAKEECTWNPRGCDDSDVLRAILTAAAIGGAAGAVVGAVHRPEHWSPIPADRLRAQLKPRFPPGHFTQSRRLTR